MKYPRVGERRYVSSKGRCVLCGQALADARVEIEVDNFRGNDVVVKVHRDCIKDLTNEELLEELENVQAN